MVRASLRNLAIATAAACTLGPVPAAAVTLVDSCRTLDKAGETYILTTNITASETCLLVLADRITVDLAGHTIAGSSKPHAGVSDNFQPRTGTLVKNGSIEGFDVAINLASSVRSTVRTVTASDNNNGLLLGQTSLVKDCIVQRVGGVGISVGDGSQVEGCLVGGSEVNGNGGVGISGANRILVTRNTAVSNGDNGIHVGANSTVTHNAVGDNGTDGIIVGARSLVSNNTSNDNGNDGIQADCPSTITHNTALGNGAQNFNPTGPGCVVLHNNFTDPE